MSVTLGVGARLPAFSASMGRVLLSGLDEPALDDWLEQCRPVQLTPHTVTDTRRLRRIVEEVRRRAMPTSNRNSNSGCARSRCPCTTPRAHRDGDQCQHAYHPDAEREPCGHPAAAAADRGRDRGCQPSHRLPAVGT
jgi:IclR family pca regulon transcriptional regulator